MGRLINTDPIVTISKITADAPFGIASVMPQAFRGRKALHIVSDTWNAESRDKQNKIAREWHTWSHELTDNEFVFLTNTSYECMQIARLGVPTFQSSELISIDESIFKPMKPEIETIPHSDAIYVGRLVAGKRHELASDLSSVIFLYGNRGKEVENFHNLRSSIPHAIFAQHMLGGGEYRRLSANEVCSLLNLADVGLCLSREEGAMRASMEYLLSGLPVVTTANIGGRNRYFSEQNCIFVDDSPAAVADAVSAMRKRNLSRGEVRESALAKIRFDRQDFLDTVNRMCEGIFGINQLLGSYTPFLSYISYQSADEFIAPVKA